MCCETKSAVSNRQLSADCEGRINVSDVVEAVFFNSFQNGNLGDILFICRLCCVTRQNNVIL